ncbi:MAG: hypothetical protein COS39_06420 [Hydrogenophilales bacterium CG03_land_8_20_14_0_80_62_28]|nr:lasso peptide biosynthesis B2 protein [Betaproteobacteria bacterium]OIO77378.1 MAG: hypothetical protein AUJ86_08925 [Hydrogenophilaceae bacterium CG1_02_62_390]PIV22775.1 MAG: hypothetical protein COS39_06420 [Hydrogenophilales bacterium CG03_land_8_20_14_0_80_62_28]PIW39399.1 MAG: hypothetical protein COW23_01575 [Hydrogenophilales bacterium CG15_BIG_FIL_POST_REV_8_21_14_020_62_31]PIY98574.1 MAG: hypothetical protein COY64_05355 [Hydrogenophilales bacterium CG_4_10_14_0_8_um_filter_62_70]
MPGPEAILIRKWRAWRRLPAPVRALFVPTWCLLGGARLATLLLPFRRLAPHLGKHLGNTAFSPLLAPGQVARAAQIGQVVELAARYAPWRARCHEQAIVARVWLGGFKIPYVLYYGVGKGMDGTLQAHAWVCAGPVNVTGGDSWAEFTVVGAFFGPG